MEPADQRREHGPGEFGLRAPLGAAMEPADQRREHPVDGTFADWWAYAAMEPADQRREHVPPLLPAPVVDPTPQWSPPTSGGSTLAAELGGTPTTPAAMEPADQRREHMDPEVISLCRAMPQWSPPTSGGSTSLCIIVAREHEEPQWSPPTSGGSTV